MVQFDIEKVVNQMDQLIRYVKLSKNPLVNEAILCQGGSIERASDQVARASAQRRGGDDFGRHIRRLPMILPHFFFQKGSTHCVEYLQG